MHHTKIVLGGIFNAQANHSPLVITAGQQSRSLMTLQANLTNRDAARMPHPLVKFSYEPPRAEDVPLALARAVHLATLPPLGPVFVSIPMDDWDRELEDPATVALNTARTVTGRAAAGPDAVTALARRLAEARNPVLVAGPDVDTSGAWEAVVSLAERQRLPVWATPAPGGGRIGFPEDHAHFRGILPPAIGPLAETLKGHDLILALGTSVFPYYPNIPGPALPDGAELIAITSDPDEAARAPMGDAIVADVRLTVTALLEQVGEADGRPVPEPRPGPEPPDEQDPMSPSAAVAALADVIPDDAIIVLESSSATLAVRNRIRLNRPGSYFFGAGGGLGFGLSAAVGVQLAHPDRPVVCGRRGLGPVRHPGALDRSGLRRAAHRARPAQRGVRDPQVVRHPGERRGRARARPPAPGHRCRRPGLRRRCARGRRPGRAARGAASGDRLRRPRPRRDARGAGHGARVVALLDPAVARIAPAATEPAEGGSLPDPGRVRAGGGRAGRCAVRRRGVEQPDL